MIPIVLIRHGPTAWNAAQRIQGHTDVSLGEIGRAEVARWSVPEEFQRYDWVASPLARAMETARLLGGGNARPEPRLMEMNWGQWEGYTETERQTANGLGMADSEARGLDFHPPGGESVRTVRARFEDWIGEVTASGQPTVAVTHKGVIRIALSIATGWDMISKSPHRLNWASAHLFQIDGNGSLGIKRLNIGLARP
ncbi:MAG: histidine phosphatase family protein [Acidiferrobacterales bacterium]